MKDTHKYPRKEKASSAKTMLPIQEAQPSATYFECGEVGHIAWSYSPKRQPRGGAIFTCGQIEHYCYTCPVPYCPRCEEHHQPKDYPMNQIACRRCGEKGHRASRCYENCPNCDEDHQLGECLMSNITYFLCEGQDHCPKDCSMRPLLTKVAKLQQTSFRVVVKLSMAEVSKGKTAPSTTIATGTPPLRSHISF